MLGTGQKRALKQLLSHLHEMLKSLGEDDTSSMNIKIDQFQFLRRDFTTAAEKYEKANLILPNTSDKTERGIQIYEISSNRMIMEQRLKKMIDLNARANNKLKKMKKIDEKVQQELDYKNLTVFHLQKIFFSLTKSEHPSVKKKEHYPEPQTIQQLKMKAPLNPNFQEEEEDLEEQEILEAIKHIDDRIQEKMDYILHGIQMLNYNALTISEGIDNVHKKILINVQNLEQNIHDMEEAQNLIDEASPNVSKPNCIMNVIIVVILGVIVYFIVRKLIPEEADDQNSLP